MGGGAPGACTSDDPNQPTFPSFVIAELVPVSYGKDKSNGSLLALHITVKGLIRSSKMCRENWMEDAFRKAFVAADADSTIMLAADRLNLAKHGDLKCIAASCSDLSSVARSSRFYWSA